MRGLLTRLSNKWHSLSWNLPYWREKRWREHLLWRDGDGADDETFPVVNVNMPGIVIYVSPDAIFYKGRGLFVDGAAEAGARRSVIRSLKLIRDAEGFVAVPHGTEVFEPRTFADTRMPDKFFSITNGNQV